VQVIGGSQSIPWEPRLSHVNDWADEQLAMLRPKYPKWDLWFVRLYPVSTSWHAKPVGERCATIHAETPEELVAAIADAEAAAP